MPSARFLIIRRRYLGDLVLLGPLVRNLRLHYPDARISVLAEAPYRDILALNPDVDDALLLPASRGGAVAWTALLWQLRRGRFTHVIDLDNVSKTAWLTRLTGAPHRIGLLHELPPRQPKRYTELVIDPAERHERRTMAEYYMEVLPVLGVPVQSREIRLYPREHDVKAMLGSLAARGVAGSGGRVLVHPGSRSAFRLWPAERFAKVITRLRDQAGAQVVLINGPSDRAIANEILRHVPGEIATFSDPLPVTQFAALASLCDVMLCHDSGPMHIAAAVGTGIVALFGSQNVALWRPPGPKHLILQAPQPCDACVAPDVCVRADSYKNYCVRRIGVDEVFAAVQSRLRPAEQTHL